ncbi:MAG: ribose 5-phosphate isomerase B [Deltaproteobacteria bacterium]|nr:ribose 5-phosphate isomerase B [Deltaproteobacteria bacterium]
MKVFLGSDHAGFALKEVLEAALGELGHEAVDLGAHSTESVDYPDFGHRVAEAVLENEGSVGVLVCGSGIGISMSANRHAGIRAALCHEPWSAEMARRHNDANVLCMGERVIGQGLARAVLEAFLAAEFEGGRHARRVGKIELSGE